MCILIERVNFLNKEKVHEDQEFDENLRNFKKLNVAFQFLT